MDAKSPPVFDKFIFWDVDLEKIDYQKTTTFIIQRVFERVDVDDIRNGRRYYGDEKVTEALPNVKWMPLKEFIWSAL